MAKAEKAGTTISPVARRRKPAAPSHRRGPGMGLGYLLAMTPAARYFSFHRVFLLAAFLTLSSFAALNASPESGTPPPVAATAPASTDPARDFPPALHVRIGPDSNACGITVPAGWNPAGRFPAGKAVVGKGGRKRPLIVWLHGGMRSQNTEKGFEAHRALTLFVPPTGYFLCSPSAFAGQEWTGPRGISHIDSLIDYMVAHYPIDPKDINLVGVSDGCLGVIAYSLAGKRDINRRILISSAPQLVLPLESLPGRPRFAQGSWDFLQGGRDRLFPPDQVVPYLRQWEKTYANSRFHYFPEGEHDFSYYAANASDLLKSLFSTGKAGHPAKVGTGAPQGVQSSPGKN
ncbi:MAG: hypothetical protein JWP91_1828 [Fibrobacteres bacterium]|nr:hypothetical protein [Fibrobacterota bacterium]